MELMQKKKKKTKKKYYKTESSKVFQLNSAEFATHCSP